MFKYILAVAAVFLTHNLLLALLGYFVGSAIDRVQNLGLGGANPITGGQRRAVFLSTTFTLMGKLAKADGRISEDEIAYVEHIIRQMGLSAEHRQQAIQEFKRGADPDYNIQDILDEFLRQCGQTKNLKQVLLTYLIVMAAADGKVDDIEKDLLEDIANRLGFSRIEFQQMFEMVLNQTQFKQQNSTSSISIDEAYKALGVSESHSDQEIKRAYRKLMSQYHPDKLIGQGMPEDMVAMATEQAKEIQVAYELIKNHRKK